MHAGDLHHLPGLFSNPPLQFQVKATGMDFGFEPPAEFNVWLQRNAANMIITAVFSLGIRN